MPAFGQRILEARKRVGWSQQELAERVGTSGPIIGRYERGRITPSIEVASKIADALGVTLDYLRGTTDEAAILQDKAMLERLEQIQKLEQQERDCLLFIIDGVLRDAKARRTYAHLSTASGEELGASRERRNRRKVSA